LPRNTKPLLFYLGKRGRETNNSLRYKNVEGEQQQLTSVDRVAFHAVAIHGKRGKGKEGGCRAKPVTDKREKKDEREREMKREANGRW
jgi:hypothetical protein